MAKLLIGTTNAGKFNEYKKLLKDYPFEFVNIKDLGIADPEETGRTFEENAILKAKHYYKHSGMLVLVDDGGFEIDALNGEPGIKSHRWLGYEMTDEELIDEVIKRIDNLPEDQRQCRLVLSVAVATPVGIMTSHASIDGVVAPRPSKNRVKGFPYRSLMYFPSYKKYFIDLTEEEHEVLNHRKQAIEKISDIFKEISK